LFVLISVLFCVTFFFLFLFSFFWCFMMRQVCSEPALPASDLYDRYIKQEANATAITRLPFLRN
jgi:hypothetical protein